MTQCHKKLVRFATAVCLMTASLLAHAQEVVTVLPIVTVTASYDVNYDNSAGYSLTFIPSDYSIWNAAHIFYQMIRDNWDQYKPVIDKKSVCVALVSSGSRQVTSTDDVINRYIAATEVFNFMVATNIIDMAFEAGLAATIKIGTKLYTTFEVSYADGVKEVWVANPTYYMSSVKLLDEPLPNSQTPYNPANSDQPKCNGL